MSHRTPQGLMHRFFVLRAARGEERWAVGQELELDASDAVHVARVLRMKPGQCVVVSDGQGFDYEARLVSVSAHSVRVCLGSAERSGTEPRLFLTLVQGIAKGSKMDFILQKAVEVGVSRIIPVTTERTVVRLDGAKAADRVERWQRIAYEAAKQAGRGRVPVVESVHLWSKVWCRDDLGFVFVPWEAAAGRGLLEAVHTVANVGAVKDERFDLASRGSPPAEGITIIIGPEGGLSADEVALAQQHGAHPVTLGPRILRTETAAIIAAALVLGTYGELG